jgi:hypothetical protein
MINSRVSTSELGKGIHFLRLPGRTLETRPQLEPDGEHVRDGAAPAELVADKSYHSREVLKDLDGGGWKSRIAEKRRPEVCRWRGDQTAGRAV